MRSSIKFILCLTLSTIALIFVAESRRTISSKEDQRALEKLLSHINKPAIKSFKTEHGYILDCIDIQKQLAFDHPLLKNHSIKLKPTSIPKWTVNNKNFDSLPIQHDGINCPIGTVIVKRVTMEDLIQAQHFKSLRQGSSNDKNTYLIGHHFASVDYEDYNYGAKGNINVWNPKVSPNQFSAASITIVGKSSRLQSISAGWIAYPKLNTNHSTVFTYWTADGNNHTGCFNTLCPGFVHVSTKYAVGVLAQPISTYGGQQYHLEVSLYQDQITGEWWFVLHDEPIGYWPRSLFNIEGLADGAHVVSWGGEVASLKEKSPTMGSGHFPQEGFKKAAYVNGIQVVIDKKSRKVLIPTVSDLKTHVEHPNCYKVENIIGGVGEWSRAIFFGGPEGCIL